MKRLVLIDGNALLHRAYHATPPLTTSKGELINAVFGFTNLLLKGISELKPDYIAVAWDMKAPTFRHGQYEKYKANRGPSDDGLAVQYDRVHELVQSFSIPEFKLPGFEADDLVGTLARLAEKQKSLEIIIITGDRDIMQLINKKIKVLMPRKTLTDVGLYGEEEFQARFGFDPIHMIDYKALAGDASDNIPGVPGIGDVTATKLLQKYTTVENVYKHLDELPERMRGLLEAGKESSELSKKLATIETNIPIKLDLDACRVHEFDREKVKTLFEELEFRSLLNRIPGLEKQNEIAASTTSPRNDNKKTIDLDQAVVPVLEKMSHTGVYIDCDFLEKLGVDLKAKLANLEQQIYSLIGHQVNINSPKQLADVLFDELNLPVVKKTKTGRSTDEETLRELTGAHDVIPCILEYRQLYKLVSTYIDTLPKYVKEDGRVHSTFNVEGAATGRLSSKDPNLQNIPIKGETGGEIRKAFQAEKGKILAGADYSQIELRIMAHLSNDPGLKKAFEQNLDIHALTAARIFKIPIEEVTKHQRMVGKTMNFATLYGQGARALSKQLDVPYATAKEYIDEYFAEFPNVQNWKTKTLEKAYEDGYVETIWGRKRYIPELKVANKMLRAFGERAAVNHPIQGTNADMIKKAMVEIDKELVTRNSSARLILQIHDELLFECDPKDTEELAKIIKDKMEHALELSVPVVVEVKSGQNWGEMSPLKV